MRLPCALLAESLLWCTVNWGMGCPRIECASWQRVTRTLSALAHGQRADGIAGSSLCVYADGYSQKLCASARSTQKTAAPGECRGLLFSEDQKDASSSSMVSLSMPSMTVRVLVSSGSMFLAKNDADAILPS